MVSAVRRGAVLAGFGAFVLIGTALAQQRQPRVVELQLTPGDATIRVGERQVFLPVAFDATNTPIAAATFEWSSSNPAVVSIDRDGVATGISAGIAIITVRTGRGAAAKTAQAPVQVTAAQGAPAARAAPVATPVVAPVAAPVPTSQPVLSPVQPQNAGRPVAAPVTPPGVPQGTAALAHQPAGTGAAEALVVRPVNAVLVPGERLQLDYRLYRTDGGAAEPQPLVFATDTGAAVPIQVDSTGLVTAFRAGRAGVRVGHPTDARLRREVGVVVGADSVRFSAATVTLPAGSTDTLGVAVPAQNRTLALDAHIFTFSSSDSSRVAVRPFAPIVEARAPGQAVITAESPHYPVPLRVTVSVRARVTAVRGTPSDSAVSLIAGQHQTFTAQALGADSSPVPDAQIRWAVEDTIVARFDAATGTLTGLRRGETRLAASAENLRGPAVRRAWRVRVIAGGLAVARQRLALVVGETATVAVTMLGARGEPLGAATELRWTSSSDSTVALSAGRLVGVRPGRARITARAAWDSTAAFDVFVVPDLVVVGRRNNRWDVFGMMRQNPAALQPITQDTLIESNVAWSPDLTRIAFVAKTHPRARAMSLYVADVDGGMLRQLTTDSGEVSSPAFLRDGETVVYASTRGGRWQVWAQRVDGTGRRVLAGLQGDARAPSVAPDSAKMLFVSTRDGNAEIYEVNLDGSGERRLTTTPRDEDQPQYAPGGRRVYFIRHEGPRADRLFRMDVETRAETAVTPPSLSVDAFAVNHLEIGPPLALVVSMLDRVPVQPTFGFVQASGIFGPVPFTRGEQVVAAAFRVLSGTAP